jgi:phospholipid/cholesterol/gamma-HCH transport system substrate-binding protein
VKPFRERNPILVGLISVAALAVAFVFAFSLNRFTFLRGVYLIEADFADAAGLTPDNEVRVAGLKVGKVRSVELASDERSSSDARGAQRPRTDGTSSDGAAIFDRVRVRMEISSGVKLGGSSEAEIKLKTILGAKFVDIVPKGRAPYLGAGRRIPLARSRVPFEIYEVTNKTVSTIGELDAKALNDSLRELADLTEDPKGNLGRALRGLAKASAGLKDRDAEMNELVRAGGDILEVLGSRSEALGRIFDSGATLLDALSGRRDALNRFVRGSNALASELSDLIRSTRGDLDPALRDLHTALEVVRGDLVPVEKAVQVLGPSAHSFANAFRQGHWADIWVQSILDIPFPPITPGGVPTPYLFAQSRGGSLAAMLLEAAR